MEEIDFYKQYIQFLPLFVCLVFNIKGIWLNVYRCVKVLWG